MAAASHEIEEISRHMQSIRTSVDADIHDLVENARTLTDWRHYWRSHPLVLCGTAAFLGYFVVPSRRFGNADAIRIAEIAQTSERRPARSAGIVSKLAGVAMGFVFRRGLQIAGEHLAAKFNSYAANQSPQPDQSESRQEHHD